jgi:shikimate kinase
MDNLSMGVVLYGFKAIGKSSLAAVVPLPPSYCHLDSDQLLLDHCQQENIADCYQRLGESRFRDLEQQLLLNLSSRRGSILLSLGGGSMQQPRVQKMLASWTKIYLVAPFGYLWPRLASVASALASSKEEWLQLYEQRAVRERPVADRILDISILTMEQAVQQVQAEIEAYEC